MSTGLDTPLRRSIRVEGVVQGVGFRPFAYRLAVRLGLSGRVWNEPGGVGIEVEGDQASLDAFLEELRRSPPPGARIRRLSSEPRPPRATSGFAIEPSSSAAGAAPSISPDLPTCSACLREVLDPADRRAGYAFAACASCGPRFTVIDAAPYDRERTSMAAFPLCLPCRAEYEDPADRRFHAESTACPDCGPRLFLSPRGGADPLAEAARLLREGSILAVKGLGGFHLACDAGHEKAVQELRRRKGRDEKPFALLVTDLAAARRICDLTAAEEELLGSAARPIVLARRRADAKVAPAVAPGNPRLGLLLPYTPLHHLLARAGPLVLTSGNFSEEPIAYDEAALESIGTIADFFLTHDRAIRSRCDDSVAKVVDGQPLVLRRSRGYAPGPLRLPLPCPKPTLALGGALKSVFALGRGDEAILSHHLGDLENYEGYRAYSASIEHYERLFRFSPELLVHDLHPDYPSTRYALDRGGIPRLGVQHHHAHMAGCMAENGLAGPVIGVTFDGTGCGTDGAVWGGEFLVGDYRAFRRAGRFEYVPLPGGEQAIREPWRMAAAYLLRAGLGLGLLEGRVPARSLEIVRLQVERGLNAPLTSSCGRLFDGVAALLGLRDRVSYEAQAAMELEWLAETSAARGHYPVELAREGETWTVGVCSIVAGVAEDIGRRSAKADVARRFHSTLVEAIRRVCARVREEWGLDRVVLSGGVFANGILLSEASAALAADGFRAYRHRFLPPNDGGLCLGQLAVAAALGG